MIKDKLKQRIKFSIVMLVIAIAIAIAIFTVMRYEVEGEKEVPFELKKIIIISSASVTDANTDEQTPAIENAEEQQNSETQNVGEQPENNQTLEESEDKIVDEAQFEATENNEQQVTEEESYIWEKKVFQTNDICILLDKNEQFEEEQIMKSVKIENIQILQNVKAGKIQVYMPNSLDDGMYKYTNDFLVSSTLTYTGAVADNKKALQIRNQGGCIYISFANVGLDEYKSNEDQEIQQGAYILEKMNIANEDLKFKVSFDLVIEVQDKSYKTNVVLDLPVDDVVGQKETHTEITDFSNIVFKRL